MHEFEPISKFQGEYRWLSNFWPCDIEYDGLAFTSTENAYQAAKFLDIKHKIEIQKLSAAQAKRYASKHKKEIRPDWDEIKLEIMEDISRLKYSITEFKDRLTLTGSREIIEGNTWNDTYWGVCKGKGENNLGKILMKIRAENNAKST